MNNIVFSNNCFALDWRRISKRLVMWGFMILVTLAVMLGGSLKANAATLADVAVGTVCKIKEDGTYQDWILVDHNYQGTGNQLLMRRNVIYYGTQMPQVWYNTSTGSNSQYWTQGTTYYSSALSDYLNNGYFALFGANFASYVRQISIPVVKGAEGVRGNVAGTINVPYKVFLLSHRELTGDLDTYGLRSSGSFITYFSTASNRGANNSYTLRDGYAGATDAGYLNRSATLIATSGAVLSMQNDGAPKYFRPCVVLPATTPLGTSNTIDGVVTPVVSAVSVPSAWATSNSITITATNAAQYAVTTTNVAPSTEWQASATFSLTSNTTYYAWAKSSTGTVSASESFVVNRVDTATPTVTGVTVPGWGTSATITIAGTDSQSGISGYAMGTSSAGPSTGYVANGQFPVYDNGTYYAFARDNVGRVSPAFQFIVDKIDKTNPTILAVNYPSGVAANVKITIEATDTGSGVAGYNMTRTGITPTSGWATNNIFTAYESGTYYLWVKDGVGNVASQYIYLEDIDGVAPVISYQDVSTEWGLTNTITIGASDGEGEGLASSAYCFTKVLTGSPPVSGWQVSNQCEVDSNGVWRAWARDVLGNASYVDVTVSKVDRAGPVISAADFNSDWTSMATITVVANDTGVGLHAVAYAFTTTSAEPTSGWQVSNQYNVSENGTYYCWVRDALGNISFRSATVNKVDKYPPQITLAKASELWGQTNVITVIAYDDESGLQAEAFAFTTTASGSAPTTGWQASNQFNATANQTYYCWVRDIAQNTSVQAVQVRYIDTNKPFIDIISKSNAWGQTERITVVAHDDESGLAPLAYCFTQTDTPTAPVSGWQSSSYFDAGATGKWFIWIRDKADNTLKGEIIINYVDRQVPGYNWLLPDKNPRNKAIIELYFWDSESGIAFVIKPDGSKVTY